MACLTKSKNFGSVHFIFISYVGWIWLIAKMELRCEPANVDDRPVSFSALEVEICHGFFCSLKRRWVLESIKRLAWWKTFLSWPFTSKSFGLLYLNNFFYLGVYASGLDVELSNLHVSCFDFSECCFNGLKNFIIRSLWLSVSNSD